MTVGAVSPHAGTPLHQLAALRRRQGGAFTRQQALAAGHSPAAIRTRLRRREWLDLERGIYVEAKGMRSRDPSGQHALRVAARVLALGGGHAGSRRSASLVLGLPLLGPVPNVPEVVRIGRRPGDRSSSTAVRIATLPATERVRWRDVESTAPARLVCDLARTHGQLEALMVADASLRACLSPLRLATTAARCASWPGGRSIAPVLALADARTDSPLESLTRWVLHRLGLPAPVSQVDVVHRGGWIARVDFAWPELGVVLEADGMGKYRQPDDGALVREKRRELALRRAGLEVVRSTWDDALHRPQQLAQMWHAHVALAAASTRLRVDTRLSPATLEPWGVDGIPFPSRAARPLPPLR